uniref:DDE Tnp4 domain-containing protein n=1 Tax=Amphiprion ocellaris TaxID=80972 RepID=A0AAQ5Z7X2_AMPOC
RPFINDPVDEGAELLHRELNIRREIVIRLRIDVLAFPDSYLFERYRFTSQSITYIHNLLRPYIYNITNHSHALTSQQILCVALRFFANGSFLYNVGDAEHLSKTTVCRAVRKVCLALKRLLPSLWFSLDMNLSEPSRRSSTGLQIICDAAYIISNVEAKWSGSVHDWRIYHESNLSNRLQRGEFDGLLLGDRGYHANPG